MGVFEFVLASPWLILAPLNFVKVLINKPSPMAHHFVAKRSEECQKNCEIARMWATMFWSLQFVLALGLLLVQRPRWMFAAAKICVGLILVANFNLGVVKLPIALAGGFELLSALILMILPVQSKDKTE
mmetsp:Transcript_14948/g.20792  ORF Transcript_14948/g.20792 Transcript_14948/m.20792 type:complete len:129 (+) Transcript_14948:80-466(+)